MVRTVGRELVAKIGQPCLSPIPIDQARYAFAAIAITPGATDLKKREGAFEIAEGE